LTLGVLAAGDRDGSINPPGRRTLTTATPNPAKATTASVTAWTVLSTPTLLCTPVIT